jgi:hypothetical protein
VEALHPIAVGLLGAQAVVLQAPDIAHLLEELFSLPTAVSGSTRGFMDSAFIVSPSPKHARNRPNYPAKKGGIFRPTPR